MKAGMNKSRWTAAMALFALVVMPSVCLAAGKGADDPGAFAALGTIYFSSVLDESGIGSGSGGRSPGGAGNAAGGAGGDGFTENNAHRPTSADSPATSGGMPIAGNSDPGNGPGGSDPDAGHPGANAPGRPLGPVAGMDDGNAGPSTDFPGPGSHIGPGSSMPVPPTSHGPSEGGYWPDDVLSDEGGLILTETPAVASSTTILQVPEPASVALFGAGLLGLGLIIRRRNAAG